VMNDASVPCQIQIGSMGGLPLAFEQILSARLASLYHPWSLWWTDGSAAVDPSCLIARGLPSSDAFVALLDGTWDRHRWRFVPATVDTNATLEMQVDDRIDVGVRSAAATDVGLKRSINEDAYIERAEVGVWAVADGLGGHRDGEVASRMVCDALAELTPEPTFEATIEAARERLQRVNEYLLRTSSNGALADRCASTVVLLLVRGSSGAVLWAGDSRVYRWRSGRLEQLTRDHNLGQLGEPVAEEFANAITRAVGVQENLVLDLCREKVYPGDRFLLCSDGLTRMVSDADIAACMNADDIKRAVQALISTTLTAGAPDNVTVLVAEAYAYPSSR